MRTGDGRKTRAQQPKTEQAAVHRHDVDDRLRPATAGPFHRDEPRRHRIEDRGAGPNVEISQAGKTRREGQARLQQDHGDMPPASAVVGGSAEAQADGTDKDGCAQQTDANEQ